MHDYTISLKSTLDNQVSEHHSRAAKDRQERMAAVVNCLINQPEFDHNRSPSRARSRSQLAKELLNQIERNANKKQEQKLRSLQEEREYLDHVAMEVDMQFAAERSAHLEKQRTLLEAWEREGHIRNLKKLQSFGATTVTDYVSSNLGIDPDSLRNSRMGVGFDIRKQAK